MRNNAGEKKHGRTKKVSEKSQVSTHKSTVTRLKSCHEISRLPLDLGFPQTNRNRLGVPCGTLR
jgi:hypothetical protein